MQKINIVVVGNLKEKYWKDACDEYLKRLSRFAKVEIKEVQEFYALSKLSTEQIKERECAEVKKHLSGYVVALDKQGKLCSSEEFASDIEKAFSRGTGSIDFVIGGSYGLTQEFVASANSVISFGKVTYPHQLMRVVLLEQLYRAETILNNIAYHK